MAKSPISADRHSSLNCPSLYRTLSANTRKIVEHNNSSKNNVLNELEIVGRDFSEKRSQFKKAEQRLNDVHHRINSLLQELRTEIFGE